MGDGVKIADIVWTVAINQVKKEITNPYGRRSRAFISHRGEQFYSISTFNICFSSSFPLDLRKRTHTHTHTFSQ